MTPYSRIKNVLDGRTTYHYVFVSAYDHYASGNIMQVKERTGIRNGGGAKSKLTPRVFDYVTPQGYKQEEVLSSYDEATYRYATVYPLEVKKIDQMDIQDEDLLQRYSKFAKEEEEKNKEALLKDLEVAKSSGKSQIELAVSYFKAGQFDNAEGILDEILENDPENSQTCSYIGSIVAMKGGKAKSPAKAIQYVDMAFDYYDKAEIHARNNEDVLVFLLNRGNLSISIPEAVFQKSLRGAEDFLKAAEILVTNGSEDKELIISCYFNVAKAYKSAGKEDEAEIYFLKALSFDDLSYSLRYELAKEGYVKEQ